MHQVKVAEMEEFLSEKQFAPGLMKPKVEAAILFAEKSNKSAVITALDNISSYLKNGDGTIILPD